ncbi:SCO2322 family protein [Streptomyces sp. NBC_00572]|uniref:SCO2322 family protein n=1 Tax=Streptomyces sp. NBC_00572 TaxID=2903664 RepID=UPI00224FA513|nr:SCO2322 family protein [Streptomyces sp. NBC_00572]MCX4980628.1 SCO2322 family protein [Streptomyces sp. NBC_00572]
MTAARRTRQARRNRSRVAGAAAGALLTLTAVAAAAAPAQAAGYRYWSFWESDGGKPWAYATQGPATARPADGDAIGFRFAISNGTNDTSLPSVAPDFSGICAGVEKKDGTKRIAVVVDFGGPADAPPGETPPEKLAKVGCAQVREDATGAEALATVAKPLRYDSAAMLCGIAGYPARGCGEPVGEQAPASAAPSASASAGEGGGGPSLGVLVGGAAVLALGGAAIWKARRRG